MKCSSYVFKSEISFTQGGSSEVAVGAGREPDRTAEIC